MSVGFVLWSMTQFSGQTSPSAVNNRIPTPQCDPPAPPLVRGVVFVVGTAQRKPFDDYCRREIKPVFLFGGRDESSYALIQGMTLAGVLFDEVALMPRSFVEQALARCSVAGSRFWFNCNPESPSHWFYEEWILRSRAKMRCICTSRWTTTFPCRPRSSTATNPCILVFSTTGIFAGNGLLQRVGSIGSLRTIRMPLSCAGQPLVWTANFTSASTMARLIRFRWASGACK